MTTDYAKSSKICVFIRSRARFFARCTWSRRLFPRGGLLADGPTPAGRSFHDRWWL